MSDADLTTALAAADVAEPLATAIVDENTTARLAGLRASLAVVAGIALIGLFLTRKLQDKQLATTEQSAVTN